MENLTVQVAEEVESMLRKEYSYRRIFEFIKEEYPSLKLKDYSGAAAILVRECSMLLANHRARPFNED